jgi:hypothetical protein
MTGYWVVPLAGLNRSADEDRGGVQLVPPLELALKKIPLEPSVQATKTFWPLFETAGLSAVPASLLRLTAGEKTGVAAKTLGI